MCNAWNHPPSCTCGWGGDGHAGRSGNYGAVDLARFSDLLRAAYDQEVRNYTTPNAKCPVCGRAVFFFQSQEGGRVFFDELGPPWPKHPCTAGTKNESQSLPVTTTASGNRPEEAMAASWRHAGWQPFRCHSAAPVPGLLNCFALSGVFAGAPVAVFVRISRIEQRAPFFLRHIEQDIFELASLQPVRGELRGVSTKAFRHL
jgi:hypothetical protein